MGNSMICEEKKKLEEKEIPYKNEIHRLKSYKQDQIIESFYHLPPEKKERLAFDVRKINFPTFDHILFKYGPDKRVEEPLIKIREIFYDKKIKQNSFFLSEEAIYKKKISIFIPLNYFLDVKFNNYDNIFEKSGNFLKITLDKIIDKIKNIEREISNKKKVLNQEMIYIIIFYPSFLEKKIKEIQFKINRNKIFFIKNEDLPIFDENGKIYLNPKYRISTRDTGIGGMLKTALISDLIEKLKKSKVEKILIQPLCNFNSDLIDWKFLEMSLKLKKCEIFLKCYKNEKLLKNETNDFFFNNEKIENKNKGYFLNENNSIVSFENLENKKIEDFFFSSEAIFSTDFLNINKLSGIFNLSKFYRIYLTKGEFFDNKDFKFRNKNLRMIKLNLKDLIGLSDSVNLFVYDSDEFLLSDNLNFKFKFF